MDEVKLGVATRPTLGYVENGDGYFIERWDDKLFLAVFDGLGHGSVAAKASEICLTTLKKTYTKDLPTIFSVCDHELKRTRGVVMGIALIDLSRRALKYAGVGNITTKVMGPQRSTHLISMDGIVGYNLPRIRIFPYQLERGDLLIMHSDGISSTSLSKYPRERMRSFDPQRVADEVLNGYAKKEDDATILIAHI
ncbi:MAG: SpoIIE family protein phosphatase [Candidatus Syntropharchaeales archaeon]